LEFPEWGFNLRGSITEPPMRLMSTHAAVMLVPDEAFEALRLSVS
jgi:hypothetical protein